MVKKQGRVIRVKKVSDIRTIRVFSRHPSHAPIKRTMKVPFLACLRLGSTTEGTLKYAVEINSIEAIKNSSHKARMKKCFDDENVKTAKWTILSCPRTFTDKGINFTQPNNTFVELQYPIVIKSFFGSRGEGNSLINNREQFVAWSRGKILAQYIAEQYHNYNKEYRLHIDSEGCFYSCRKMIKDGTPEDQKWHRHDNNSVWILENNPEFDRPSNWNTVVEHCVKALKGVGLDVGAIDLKIQNNTNNKGKVRENPEFIVIEINSAPSFGEQTLQKYLTQIPIIAKRKYENLRR